VAERAASALALPPAILQEAKAFLEELPKHATFHFRAHPATAAAALYLACRMRQRSVLLAEVAGALGIGLKAAGSAYM
jgi:transcription initiation factor TFIIIB Brf1 subunit/transcription initiation factor TFIIB